MLTLLLAERAVAADTTGDVGALLLDDVISELDDSRRRLLVGTLSAGGQAIVTTTNRLYFTDEELAGAHVIDIGFGSRLERLSSDASGGKPVPPGAAGDGRGDDDDG